MHYAARDVWAQFELFLLQQQVLYVNPAAHTTQAQLRMVVLKHLVEQALVEVHDGVAGAHLGGMQSIMKVKARVQRPGTTKEVHCYCDRCPTCGNCKPRANPEHHCGHLPLATPRNTSILTWLLPSHDLGGEIAPF